MADGIQIFNDKGSLQISSDYKNYAVKEIISNKGSYFDWTKMATVRGKGFNHNGAFVAIKPDPSLPANDPRIGPRDWEGPANKCSPFTRDIYNFGTGTIYVFDLPENIKYTSSSGLEIYDATGKVAFSSDLKYMRVIDSSFIHKKAGNGEKIWNRNGIDRYDGFKYTMNYGHPNIAVVFLMSYHEEEDDFWDGGWTYYTLMSSVEMAPNYDVTIRDFWNFIQPYTHVPPPEIGYRKGVSSTCDWLVLDVTGY